MNRQIFPQKLMQVYQKNSNSREKAIKEEYTYFLTTYHGGFRGDAPSPPQGVEPLPKQRVPPLYHFEISIFGDGH